MVEKFDEVLIPGNIPAERAHGLRQCADLYVHTPMESKVIDRATPVFPKYPARMGIVDHHDAPMLFGQVAQTCVFVSDARNGATNMQEL